MSKVSIPKLHSIKWKDGVHADNVDCHPDRGAVDIPARDVLVGAINADLTNVVIAGYDQNGREYIAGSFANIGEGAYMFGRGQLTLLRYGDEHD